MKNNTKRPSRANKPNVSQRIERAIINAKSANLGYSATKLISHLKNNRKTYHLRVDDIIPAKRAIQYIVHDNQDLINKIATDDLQQKWDIGKLKDYDLIPAVVPVLLSEQSKRVAQNQNIITIRQSLWASRLYTTMSTLLADKPESIAESIIYWSGEYAIREVMSEYNKEPFMTSDLDEDLLKTPNMSLDGWIQNHQTEPGTGKTDNVFTKDDIRNAFYPPSHLPEDTDPIEALFITPDIDFKKRDKKRKKIQKEREKQQKDGAK